MQHAEECGNEEQRGYRCEKQAADHGPSQRSVLLAAVSHSQRHRNHADDHGQSGHQHRTKTREARLQGGGNRIFACDICSVAKLTTRMLFAVATPMHMMVPMSAGTLRVVCVMNRNQAIPASAAGNAEIMMKGSSHDWKFTTISR